MCWAPEREAPDSKTLSIYVCYLVTVICLNGWEGSYQQNKNLQSLSSAEPVDGWRDDPKLSMGMLNKAMDVLNERERAIFQARRLQESPSTLEELAQHYEVSRERIRQIEVRAFEKVQEAVKEAASA